MEMNSEEPFLVAKDTVNYFRFDITPDSTLVKSPMGAAVPEEWRHLLSPIPLGASPQQLPAELRYITVINSTKSGAGQSSKIYFNVLLPLFNEFGIHHVFVKTHSSECVADHARSFITSGTVLLLGGDTTVHEFVNGLAPTTENLQMRIVVVPTGTGNALAHSTGHGTPLEAVSSLFTSSVFKPLSVFPVTLPGDAPRCAVVVFSFGLHAGLVADSDDPEMRKLGSDRFAAAARALVARDPVYRASSPLLQGSEHSYYLVTPMRYLDTNFLISPRGDPPSSGALHLVHIPKTTGDRFMEIMGQAYNNGAHVDMEEVLYTRVESTTLEILEQPPLERRVCVDGATFTPDAGTVQIGSATSNWNGWRLFMWV